MTLIETLDAPKNDGELPVVKFKPILFLFNHINVMSHKVTLVKFSHPLKALVSILIRFGEIVRSVNFD